MNQTVAGKYTAPIIDEYPQQRPNDALESFQQRPLLDNRPSVPRSTGKRIFRKKLCWQ